jgi:alpha-ketoglutarate-dependent taurine dioxygenase
MVTKRKLTGLEYLSPLLRSRNLKPVASIEHEPTREEVISRLQKAVTYHPDFAAYLANPKASLRLDTTKAENPTTSGGQ